MGSAAEDRVAIAALCGWNNVPPDNEAMRRAWNGLDEVSREAWRRAVRAALCSADIVATNKALEAATRDYLRNHCQSSQCVLCGNARLALHQAFSPTTQVSVPERKDGV